MLSPRHNVGTVLASAVLMVFCTLVTVRPALAQTSTAQLSGSVSSAGGFGLVQWGGGTTAQLQASAAAHGCTLRSAFVTDSRGPVVGYIYGAPDFVNAGFMTAFPALALPAGQLLVIVCADTRAAITSDDPFDYCARVGTIDAPDARYTGPNVPEAVAQGIKQAVGAPASTPVEVFVRSTSWRCMDGNVYACTVGANLPCTAQADTSNTPTAAMIGYCASRPDADVIPAFVTGRATVFLWRCAGTQPVIVRQVAQPDERGFLANIWHALPRPSSP